MGGVTMADIFITGSARTAIGSFQGAFSTLSAPELGDTPFRRLSPNPVLIPQQLTMSLWDVFCQQD